MQNFIFDLQKDYDFILDKVIILSQIKNQFVYILFTNISKVWFAYIDALYAGELT